MRIESSPRLSKTTSRRRPVTIVSAPLPANTQVRRMTSPVVVGSPAEAQEHELGAERPIELGASVHGDGVVSPPHRRIRPCAPGAWEPQIGIRARALGIRVQVHPPGALQPTSAEAVVPSRALDPELLRLPRRAKVRISISGAPLSGVSPGANGPRRSDSRPVVDPSLSILMRIRSVLWTVAVPPQSIASVRGADPRRRQDPDLLPATPNQPFLVVDVNPQDAVGGREGAVDVKRGPLDPPRRARPKARPRRKQERPGQGGAGETRHPSPVIGQPTLPLCFWRRRLLPA